MVVICPKCKVRLKVADEKIANEGTRFKCPKCSTVLLVKRPAPRMRPLNQNTVLVAHEESLVVEKLKSVLMSGGYRVITAQDGIAAMVNATRDLPFLAVLGVSIPKIYGFEVCRRLKSRPETKDMKIILFGSIYDENKYRRQPESFHGADAYIEEHQIEEMLVEKISLLKGVAEKVPPPLPEAVNPAGEAKGVVDTVVEKVKTEERPRPMQPQPSETNVGVEKAKRLARTILSDIYLYGKAKVEEAVRNDTFEKTFSSELREGLKLYEARISAEVKDMGDFYNEAINNFIAQRKKELSQ